MSVGGTALSQNTAYGLGADTQYFAISKLVDAITGAAANDSVTIEVQVPAGLEGKDLVVFQTLYNGSDVAVGRHLDTMQLLDGTTYLVAHRDPADTDQTVKVFQPVQPCTISGYIWKDAKNNGVMNSGEEKVPNVTADLRSIPDNVLPGTVLKSTTTDANGCYTFEVPGDHPTASLWIATRHSIPVTWKGFSGGDSDLSAPNLNAGWSNSFNVVPGQNVERIDAGLRAPPTGTTIVGNFCAEAQFGGYIADLYNENTGQWDRSVVLQNGSKAFKLQAFLQAATTSASASGTCTVPHTRSSKPRALRMSTQRSTTIAIGRGTTTRTRMHLTCSTLVHP